MSPPSARMRRTSRAFCQSARAARPIARVMVIIGVRPTSAGQAKVGASPYTDTASNSPTATSDIAGSVRPRSATILVPVCLRVFRRRTAKTIDSTISAPMIRQIGRASHARPSCAELVMNSAFSMIGPITKPSTIGGRGTPPCFIT